MLMRNPFALRAKLYRSIALAGTWYTLAIMDDDKLTWKDTPESLALAGGLTWIWWDTALATMAVSTTPLMVVEAAVVGGLVASVAIGGVEGGEKYVEYINPLNYPEHIKDPAKMEALMQASEIGLAIAAPHVWVGGKIVEYTGKEITKYKEEIFKNRFLTGPYLPF